MAQFDLTPVQRRTIDGLTAAIERASRDRDLYVMGIIHAKGYDNCQWKLDGQKIEVIEQHDE